MVDGRGNDLKTRRYLKYGQNEHLPVISVANQELLRVVKRKL